MSILRAEQIAKLVEEKELGSSVGDVTGTKHTISLQENFRSKHSKKV